MRSLRARGYSEYSPAGVCVYVVRTCEVGRGGQLVQPAGVGAQRRSCEHSNAQRTRLQRAAHAAATRSARRAPRNAANRCCAASPAYVRHVMRTVRLALCTLRCAAERATCNRCNAAGCCCNMLRGMNGATGRCVRACVPGAGGEGHHARKTSERDGGARGEACSGLAAYDAHRAACSMRRPCSAQARNARAMPRAAHSVQHAAEPTIRTSAMQHTPCTLAIHSWVYRRGDEQVIAAHRQTPTRASCRPGAPPPCRIASRSDQHLTRHATD
jgi:hypothetical protein